VLKNRLGERIINLTGCQFHEKNAFGESLLQAGVLIHCQFCTPNKRSDHSVIVRRENEL